MTRWIHCAIMAVLAACASSLAMANEPVERGVHAGMEYFHRAGCSRAVAPGQARCHAHIRTNSVGEPMAGRNASGGTPSGYGPADLRSAYKITTPGSASTIIAIVDAYGYPNAEADLAVYRAQYGLPPCTSANGCFIKINQTGGTVYPAYNLGWAQEQALDIQMASAMCPNCRIMLVQATNANLSSLAAGVTTAIARGAAVVSNSYGGGEQGTSGYAAYFSHPGIAITASAGDSGYGAQFPATAPGVIAVGGTSLVRASNARGWNETVWSGTGSGCSAVFAKPVWQTDKLCSRRMEADIAAVGDPYTGVAVYGPTGRGTASGWMVFGGTSVSAPVIAGIYGVSGAHPNAAQKLWQASSGLFDVTSGKNGTCGGSYFCNAGAGYDGPTGNGTPNGTAAF